MALSADKTGGRKRRGTPLYASAPIADGVTVYIGSLVAIQEGTGRLTTVTDGAARKVYGVVEAFATSDGGPGTGTGVGDAAGTQYALCGYGCEYEFAISAALDEDQFLLENASAADDDTLSTSADIGSNSQVAGTLTEFTNAARTLGFCAIRKFAPADA
jgi:hypothetical protein